MQCAELRGAIEVVALPGEVAAAIRSSLDRFGERSAYAIRSSATAEDQPRASFAGLHDTFLGITGSEAILHHVRRCWASIFTERAVTYRLQTGVRHHDALMAVVVQQMLVPECSGVMFTADPVTSNRKVVSVEASFGLGEALVSGLVDPDVFVVRDGEIEERTIGTKQVAVVRVAGRRDATGAGRARAPGPAGPDRCPGGPPRRCSGAGSSPTSVHRRTSSGAWSATTSTSSRAGRSPRCSRSPGPTTAPTTSTSRSATSR